MCTEIKEFTKLITPKINSDINQIEFGFKGFRTIFLNPNTKPFSQKIVKKSIKDGYIWIIIMHYSNTNWDNFIQYATTHELEFNIIYNSVGICIYYTLFKCMLTLNQSWIYKINTDDINFNFKQIEIKVIKKVEKTVMIIKIL